MALRVLEDLGFMRVGGEHGGVMEVSSPTFLVNPSSASSCRQDFQLSGPCAASVTPPGYNRHSLIRRPAVKPMIVTVIMFGSGFRERCCFNPMVVLEALVWSDEVFFVVVALSFKRICSPRIPR